MAPHHLSWVDSNPQQASSPTQNHQYLYNYTQGATCQPLESALPLQQYQYQQAHYPPGAFVAPSPKMQFTKSPPPLAFDSSPDQQYSDMEGFELDHDILNNLSYLEDINFTDYNDFDLFPTSESSAQSPFTNASLFPSLDSYNSAEVGPLQTHKYRCPFGDCTESFPRQCELTRHEYKHTRPFQCPHCGQAFAEKRRCVQHIQSVHGLATDKDKTKCHLCKYAHVRPDAVKRHLRLKHGVGIKSETSPSTNSEEQSDKEGVRRRGRKQRR